MGNPKGKGPLTVHESVRPQFLNRLEVSVLTTISSPTLRRMERDGKFPRRRQLTPNRVGWVTEEVLEWVRSRPVAPLPKDEEDYHEPRPREVPLLDPEFDAPND